MLLAVKSLKDFFFKGKEASMVGNLWNSKITAKERKAKERLQIC